MPRSKRRWGDDWMERMDDVYIDLANAIILQALDDYCIAILKRRKNPRDQDAAVEIAKIRKFFASDHFRMLSRVDGPALLRKARAELEETQSYVPIRDILKRVREGRPKGEETGKAMRKSMRAQREKMYGDEDLNC